MSPALALVSPVFPTRSHPGAPALGVARAAALARALPLPAFALGGLDARGAARLRGTPFQGIAVLGAWEDRGEETGGGRVSAKSREPDSLTSSELEAALQHDRRRVLLPAEEGGAVGVHELRGDA